MTNDLKNFLEKNSEIETFDGAVNVSEHNNKVVNFVLELVEKEVGEYKKRIGMPSGFGENAVRADASRDTLDYISTIINNLRV